MTVIEHPDYCGSAVSADDLRYGSPPAGQGCSSLFGCALASHSRARSADHVATPQLARSPIFGRRGDGGAEVASHADVAAEGEGGIGMAEEGADDGGVEADIEEEPAGADMTEIVGVPER